MGHVVNPIDNTLLYRNRGRRIDKATRNFVVESWHLSKQCGGWRHLSDTENSLCESTGVTWGEEARGAHALPHYLL